MRTLVLLVAILIGLATPVRAADDVAAAQSTIRAQGDAISRDDAAAAYSYAAPVIKQVFTQPEIFMFMVRQGYAPLYKPRSFEFGAGRVLESGVAQVVYITDAEGIAWEALYTLEKEPDGNFKITGCSLKKVTTA